MRRGQALPARKRAQIGFALIVTILSGFVKRNLSGKNLHLACGETVRSLKVPAGDFISATQEFSAGHLHFIGIYGNIIRQYCIAAEYALVAQPVEHLTFNQRARDSSSLERTKIPRRIVRFLVGFSFFWGSAHFLHTGGKAVFFLALSAFCAS